MSSTVNALPFRLGSAADARADAGQNVGVAAASSTARKVVQAAATCSAMGAAVVVARKVGTTTGRSCAVGTGMATSRKVAPSRGVASGAVAATGTARKAAPAAGLTSAAGTPSGTARKITPTTVASRAAGSAYAAAKHVLTPVGRGVASGIAYGTVAKRAPAIAAAPGVVSALHSGTPARAVTARASMSATAAVLARKTAKALPTSVGVAAFQGTARHVLKAFSASPALGSAASVVGRRTPTTGRAAAALTAYRTVAIAPRPATAAVYAFASTTHLTPPATLPDVSATEVVLARVSLFETPMGRCAATEALASRCTSGETATGRACSTELVLDTVGA